MHHLSGGGEKNKIQWKQKSIACRQCNTNLLLVKSYQSPGAREPSRTAPFLGFRPWKFTGKKTLPTAAISFSWNSILETLPKSFCYPRFYTLFAYVNYQRPVHSGKFVKNWASNRDRTISSNSLMIQILTSCLNFFDFSEYPQIKTNQILNFSALWFFSRLITCMCGAEIVHNTFLRKTVLISGKSTLYILIDRNNPLTTKFIFF